MPDQLADELARIKKLHGEIVTMGKNSLEKGFETGELLTDIKGRFTKGNWTLWVEANLPFEMRQAQRYMKLFSKRKNFIGIKDLNFTKAITLISAKASEKSRPRTANQRVTSGRDSTGKRELTPEEQAEADIKSASNPEQNGAPEKAVDAQGIPIPKEALPYWNRRQEVQELLTAISRVKCRFERAQSESDLLFSWLSNNVIPKLESAYAAVTNSMPYAVCVECSGHAEKIKCTVCHGTGLISKYAYDFQADKGKISIRAKAYANRPA